MRFTIVLLTGVLLAAVGRAEEPAPPPRDAAKELAALQGRWKMRNSILVADRRLKEHLPDHETRLAAVRVDGNRLHLAGNPALTLTFAHNLGDEDRTGGIQDHQRIFFTFPDGRGLMGSFAVKDDALEVRIPPHCCSRSGAVLSFQRVKE